MNRQVIKNRIRKILAYTFASISFVVISAFLSLQIPAVQEYLINSYLDQFSQITGFRSTVTTFRLLWFDRLELEDVTIYDPENNEMIGAKRIMINFKLMQLLDQRDINVDGVTLDSARVYVTKIADSDTSTNLNINVFINRINEHYASTSGTGRNPRINIGEAVLTGSNFSYVDQYRDSIDYGFNYNQFTFDIDEAQLQNFMILGDTTEFNVKTLLAADRQSPLRIKELSTFFRLSQASMEFTNLKMLVNESTISDSIVFTYNGQRELSDFIEKVDIHGHLENTVLQPRDLALFAPQVKNMTYPIHLAGDFKGRINNFKFTNMEVKTGNTVLRGSVDMEGLPDLNETFIILDLKDSRLEFADLGFVVDETLINRLTPLGRVHMDGQFLGYPTDFVAKGTFSGDLGLITSDINFKVNEQNFDKSIYSGNLKLTNFDLGTYLADTVSFQKVSLDGKVKGSGLTTRTADFTLNGKVSSIGIRSYNYTRIETDARFASELFSGFFTINDPNLEFTARGSVDLRKGADLIKITAQLDTAFLHNLNLSPKSIFLQSEINVDTKGLHIDSLVGTATLHDFTIHYEDQQLSLKDIRLMADRNGNTRRVKVESTLFDAEARGDFLLTDISNDIQKLVKEILLNIRNDEQAIQSYYATENYRPKSYETEIKVNLKDVDRIAELVKLDVQVSNNTLIEGKFISGYTTILQAYTSIDSISINKVLFLNTEAELTASKIADSTNVLAMAFINSDNQVVNKNLRTQKLVAEAIWNKNHIDFGFDADQVSNTNAVRLKGEVDFLQDTTKVRMLPSSISMLEKNWQIDPDNLITIFRKEIGITDLRLRHENESVLFRGKISEDPDERLSLTVNQLDLSLLNPLTGREIEGTLNAVFDLTDYYKNPYVQNDLTIDSLTIDHFLIGDVTGKNQWDNQEKKFLIDFFIDRNDNRIVNLNGFYNPSKENSPLDVTARLEKANLKIIEPFFDDFFSNIGGSITGEYQITGKLQTPSILGEGKVSDGQIMINYLKTLYRFTGTVGLSPNSIYFKNIELHDLLNNEGRLSGTITHRDFRDTRINIDASFRNFQVLNTSSKDNSLFYGQGFATGDLNIFGPVSNLKFSASARTDKNTRIFIPIDEVGDVTQSDFIKFVSFTDSTFQQNLKKPTSTKLDLTGITIDFNLDVTPDAFCQIILDQKAGDIIYGRGNGQLQLQLDTKGEFNMFGPFEFTEGVYNFTLYDIVSKDFTIQRGSRITWFGDPYTGVLDINATYDQQASFGPIISTISDEAVLNSPQLRRKYPVQVLLKVQGPLLNTTLDFDIVTRDLPQTIIVSGTTVRLDFEFQAFKNKMDEQELKRQVFSLIVLRRFSPPDAFNTSGSLVNSVSEFLSNQLSNWANQVDENLEIDVDLSTFNEDAYNTFQLRLSYTFMNGRLRITRDGTIYGSQNNNTLPGNNPNQVSTIAGDWTVDYLLTADGKWKVKMYNRTNINPILNTLNTGNSVTTGFSLSNTRSFNQIKDIWRSSRKRREQQQQNQSDKEINDEATKKEDDGGE
jgi:hypothetical protein